MLEVFWVNTSSGSTYQIPLQSTVSMAVTRDAEPQHPPSSSIPKQTSRLGFSCDQPYSRPLNVWIQLVVWYLLSNITWENGNLFKLVLLKHSLHLTSHIKCLWKHWATLSRGKLHRHPQHSTYRSHLHHHSCFPPSVSTEDVIHIKAHTYRSSYKEKKKSTHTIQHSDGIIEARQSMHHHHHNIPLTI